MFFRNTQLVVAAIILFASAPAQATPITRAVTGFLSAPAGSPANIGAGSVIGGVTYDDSFDLGLNPATDLFALTQFNLGFSNGPAITELDDPLAQIEIDTITKNLVALTVFAPSLNGFGLTDLTFQTDFSAPTLFFSDNIGNVVVGGIIGFAAATAIPEPPTYALFAFPLLTLAALRYLVRR